MPYANPSGVNGPRQGSTTGRLRQALTNKRGKQNVFPSELVRREVLPQKPASGAQRTGLQQPSQAEAPDLKAAVDRLKSLTTPQVPQPQAVTPATGTLSPVTVPTPGPNLPMPSGEGGTPKANMALGKNIAASLFGWTGKDWQFIRFIVEGHGGTPGESNWNDEAKNPSSGAIGIGQRLLSAHPWNSVKEKQRYLTDPAYQLRWMFNYIKGRYGSPAAAWAFKQEHGWY